MTDEVEVEATKTVIKFKQVESGQEVLIQVFDNAPHMQDMHFEGRRTVEVSIEMFMTLMKTQGFFPVTPNAKLEEAPVAE